MGPPVDLGDKAVIPVARFGFGFGAGGGFGEKGGGEGGGAGGGIEPVALLTEEEGAWSFVSLEEATGQAALIGLLSPTLT
jgi:uncharacterized spore protein YtfJ